jgi:hypothetical protein
MHFPQATTCRSEKRSKRTPLPPTRVRDLRNSMREMQRARRERASPDFPPPPELTADPIELSVPAGIGLVR